MRRMVRKWAAEIKYVADGIMYAKGFRAEWSANVVPIKLGGPLLLSATLKT